MDSWLWDVRHALRSLTRAPAFAVVAVLSLSLGIGANSAIFSLCDEVLFRPLPVHAPEQLRLVHVRTPDGPFGEFSHPELLDLAAARDPALDGVAAYSILTGALETERGATRSMGAQVSGDYFGMLGVRAALGRVLSRTDDRPGAAPVVMLSHDLWRRSFASDPRIVGQVVRVNQVACEVVGVAPRGFRGTLRGVSAEFWVALATGPSISGDTEALTSRNMRWLTVVARVPGRDADQRAAAALTRSWNSGLPPGDENLKSQLGLKPGGRGDTYLLDGPGRVGGVLMAVVVLLLAIASANVAGLLLARTESRRREIGIRLALGGTAGRIARQFLIESLMLSVAGGLLGVLFALWVTDALRAFTPSSPFPLDLRYTIDQRVILFTAAVSLVTGIAFGLAPALWAARGNVLDSLRRDPGAGWFNRRALTPRRVLVAAQVGLSVVLLTAAGLFLRTLWNERAIPLGFDPAGRIAVSLDLGATDFDGARATRFYQDLLERVSAQPGVHSATLTQYLPPSPGGSRWDFPADAAWPGAPALSFDVNGIGPNFFETFGIPLVAGRDFTPPEAMPAPRPTAEAGAPRPVPVIVNQALARRLWGAENPLGRRVALLGPDQPTFEVIGVARDARYRGLREEQRQYLYLSGPLRHSRDLVLVVHSSRATGDVLAAVRSLVRELEPRVAMFGARSMEQHVAESMVETRFASLLLGVFGALALALTSLGLYGLIAFAVQRRTREIGLRIVFGATPGRVLRMILGESLAIAAPGLIAGVAAALALSRLVAGLLYGVSPVDPPTYAAIAVLLLAALTVASWIPGRRAARLEPMSALREE